MWDKYWLQFRSTISEDFEETEVSEITLTITSFVKKESVEALTVKKNTQNHAQGMLEKVKVRWFDLAIEKKTVQIKGMS